MQEIEVRELVEIRLGNVKDEIKGWIKSLEEAKANAREELRVWKEDMQDRISMIEGLLDKDGRRIDEMKVI